MCRGGCDSAPRDGMLARCARTNSVFSFNHAPFPPFVDVTTMVLVYDIDVRSRRRPLAMGSSELTGDGDCHSCPRLDGGDVHEIHAHNTDTSVMRASCSAMASISRYILLQNTSSAVHITQIVRISLISSH